MSFFGPSYFQAFLPVMVCEFAEAIDPRGAFGAEDFVGVFVVAAGLLAAEDEAARAVGIFVRHREVIVDVAVLLLDALLAPADARWR